MPSLGSNKIVDGVSSHGRSMAAKRLRSCPGMLKAEPIKLVCVSPPKPVFAQRLAEALQNKISFVQPNSRIG